MASPKSTPKTDGAPTRRAFPLSRAELARRLRRAKSTISEHLRPGGRLHPACLPGGRVDGMHPAVQALAAECGIDPAAVVAPGRAPAATPAPDARRAAAAEPLAIESLLELKLREITERFGSVVALQDWLDARKTVSEITKLEIANAEAMGRLISRELVRTHIFGAIDSQNRRLLSDLPRTIASRLYGLAGSGAPLEEAEALVREHVSSQLKIAKETAVRILRAAPAQKTRAKHGAKP